MARIRIIWKMTMNAKSQIQRHAFMNQAGSEQLCTKLKALWNRSGVRRCPI
jgi:hypothetical protein